MKHPQHKTLLIVLFTIVCGFLSLADASALNTDSLHRAGWDNVLAAAGDNEAARYAFYAYRSLAVPHPEIYLQGDALFAEVIESMPGSRAAQRGVDARDVDLFRALLKGEHEGPSFTWRSWAPLPDSIYDRQENGTSFLDRRVSPMAVILTAISPHLSTAEAAMMRYTQLRRTGHPAADLFIIIDNAGTGYLAQGGAVLSAATGRAYDGDASIIVPALVFNENSVCYPLFGRDDRAQDQNLAQIVATLADTESPSLTADDQTRINRLRTIAALDTEPQRELAKLAAFGAAGVENLIVRAAWERAIGTDAVDKVGCVKGLIRLIIYWANHLSPQTAELAALAPDLGFESAVDIWQDTYLEWCGRRVNPRDTTDTTVEAGGYLWAYELIDVTFDDIIRTRSGPPSSQALAMAAALDVLGIPNVRMDIEAGEGKRPDQHWILCEEGRWQFNLGVWTRINTEIERRNRVPVFLGSYGITGRWTNVRDPYYLTNSDAATIHEDLTRLTLMMPYAKLNLRPQHRRIMPLQNLMLQLANGEVNWSSLPWPSAPTGTTGNAGGSQ